MMDTEAESNLSAAIIALLDARYGAENLAERRPDVLDLLPSLPGVALRELARVRLPERRELGIFAGHQNGHGP